MNDENEKEYIAKYKDDQIANVSNKLCFLEQLIVYFGKDTVMRRSDVERERNYYRGVLSQLLEEFGNPDTENTTD